VKYYKNGLYKYTNFTYFYLPLLKYEWTKWCVSVCPESIWLWHNATNSSYPKLSTEYNRPLSFNKTIAIEFECIYEPKFYHITTFEWTVTAESDDGLPFQTQGNDRFLQYYFEDTGDYVVKCRAWFVIENCTCDNMTDVLITINGTHITYFSTLRQILHTNANDTLTRYRRQKPVP